MLVKNSLIFRSRLRIHFLLLGVHVRKERREEKKKTEKLSRFRFGLPPHPRGKNWKRVGSKKYAALYWHDKKYIYHFTNHQQTRTFFWRCKKYEFFSFWHVSSTFFRFLQASVKKLKDCYNQKIKLLFTDMKLNITVNWRATSLARLFYSATNMNI